MVIRSRSRLTISSQRREKVRNLWTTICKSFSLTCDNRMIKAINPHYVLQAMPSLISSHLPYSLTSSATAEEKNITSNLYKCLNFILESTYHQLETETTLDHNDEIDDQDLKDLSTSTSDDNKAELADNRDYEPVDPYKLHNHFLLDYMKGVVEFFDEINPSTCQRKRKWSTVKRCFRRVPDLQCIAHFPKYIEAGGTQQQEIEVVDKYVYDRFEHTRCEYISVHDIDLRRWILQKAHELNLHDFQASNGWLSKFKNSHGICSRRATKLMTKRMIESPEEIKQSAEDFVSMSKKIIKKYHLKEVLNIDQLGIKLESHSKWTLTYSGRKFTWASVQSTGASIHSFTIQPMITMHGSVIDQLYVCLKGPKGHISKNLKKKLFYAKKTVFTCSKSGKLSSSLITY